MVIELEWRCDYNQVRSHSALGYRLDRVRSQVAASQRWARPLSQIHAHELEGKLILSNDIGYENVAENLHSSLAANRSGVLAGAANHCRYPLDGWPESKNLQILDKPGSEPS